MSQDKSMRLNPERYEYHDGYCVDRKTGERIETAQITAPIGSTHRTPAQQEAYKKIQSIKNYQEKRRSNNKELGPFYFATRQNHLGALSPETAARLIYLCTYLGFDNYFWRNKSKKLKKADLKSLLKVSDGTVFKFWKEVNPLYLTEDEEGYLRLNSPDIVRGLIRNNNISYQRFFSKFVRKIYEETSSTKHKHLGYIFQILPFVSLEYNILCWNPEEENLEEINALSIKDFCELINFDASNPKRLMDRYNQITFNHNGHREYFLSYVFNSSERGAGKMFVNPKIFYAGKDYKRVEILGAFTKEDEKEKKFAEYLESRNLA